MTKKRLRKKAKNYGEKKKTKNTRKMIISKGDLQNRSNSSTQSEQNVDSRNSDGKCSDDVTGAGNGPVTSALPPYSNAAVSKMFRFRPMNATVGREFNHHNDVWHPLMMDIAVDSNHIYPCGLTGLINLGNTCYMNAAIQALSNCPPFSDFFRSLTSVAPYASKTTADDGEPPISRSFRRLLQALWSEERNGCISPQSFLVQIRHHCPQFRGWAQQDAQEFIRCLLDLLHRELRQPVFAWEWRNITRSRSRQMEEANNAGSSARDRSASSSSGSRISDDDERYETADSGWSSDGDRRTPSKGDRWTESERNGQLSNIPKRPVDHKKIAEVDERSRFDRTPIYYRSLVTEVFDGQLRSVVKCLTCQHLSETYETFQDLSLSIPTKEQLEHIASHSVDVDNEGELKIDEEEEKFGDDDGSSWQWPWWLFGGFFRSVYRYFFGDLISLNDALAAFFSPDDLRGENMYSCEKCAKLRNGVKICKIVNPPEILCIHLKRFRHELSYSNKVRTTVTFPAHDLDLAPFIASSDADNNPVLYDLVSFITHYGGSAESGHYVAYCKNEVDDNWYEFDDNVVTRLETADVLTKEAYVLFYQRQSSRNMDKIRNNVRQMLEENAYAKVKVKAPLHHYISREWLHRLSTFSHPGPITNHDFLCQHSQILPRRAAHLTDYYATISTPLWNFLQENFGGGPASSELHYCLLCQSEYHMMKHKREIELKDFMTLEARYKKLRNDMPALTFGHYIPPNIITKSWIDKWKAFIDGDESEPPGPIDNSNLLVCSNTNDSKSHLRLSQYMQLPRELWLYLHAIYGGGPELLCIQDCHPSAEKLQELIEKVSEKILEAYRDIKREDLYELLSSSDPSGDVETADANNEPVLPCSNHFTTDFICLEN